MDDNSHTEKLETLNIIKILFPELIIDTNPDIKETDFDIIIDDGGHHMHEQITSFETLFPHLKSGGLYIIEDLHTSYWLSYRGNKHGVGNRNTVGFLKNLINDVNYVGYKLESPNQEASGVDSLDLNIYQKEILSMTFFGSLCFIVKR